MKISDRRLGISDSLKISDFSNSLGVLQHPQQYAYGDEVSYRIADFSYSYWQQATDTAQYVSATVTF